MSKLPKDKLPKCEGPGKCPIGGNHGGNGDTKSLGCSLCPNIASRKEDFWTKWMKWEIVFFWDILWMH